VKNTFIGMVKVLDMLNLIYLDSLTNILSSYFLFIFYIYRLYMRLVLYVTLK